MFNCVNLQKNKRLIYQKEKERKKKERKKKKTMEILIIKQWRHITIEDRRENSQYNYQYVLNLFKL